MKRPVLSLILFGVVVLLVTVAIRHSGSRSAVGSTGTTYGLVLVDSPEIYTRERMVNDRFRQEAWLFEALDRETTPGVQGQLDSSVELKNIVDIESGSEAADDEDSGMHSPPNGTPEKERSQSDTSDSQQPRLRPIEVFRLQRAYREEVRNAIIENQLDDRHDLNGNTLYRLKFDATVIPGNDTSAWARIRIQLRNTMANDENQLRSVYRDWVELLDEQVNRLAQERIQEAKTIQERFNAIRGPAEIFLPLFSDEASGNAPISIPEVFSEQGYRKLISDVKEKVRCPTEGSCLAALLYLDVLRERNYLLRLASGEGTETTSLQSLLDNTFVGFSLQSKPVSIRIVPKSKEGFNAFREILESIQPSQLFAYAVTPRESTQQISSASRSAAAQQIRASAARALGVDTVSASAASSSLFSEYARILDSRPIVVGIASHPNSKITNPANSEHATRVPANTGELEAQDGDTSSVSSDTETQDGGTSSTAPTQFAEFGWLIGPKFVVGPSGLGVFRHHPSQNSLAALISAPSWWRRADISIETDWLDHEGKSLGGSEIIEFEVALPGDAEEVTTLLLLGGKRPAPTIDWVEAPIKIQRDGGRTRAEVLIGGENLWRSAVVTVGSVRSQRISVLPNMKGIVAGFWEDELRALSDRGVDPVLRVWTSEGVADWKSGVPLLAE